jgi:hypothetical protein
MPLTDEPKISVLATNWDKIIEVNLKHIAEKCSCLQFMHREMAYYYQNTYDRLTLTALILTPLPGFFSALSINVDTQSYPNVFPVINTCASVGGAICMSILKMLNLKQNIHNHKNIASRYDALNNNIRRQLSVSRSHRVPAGEYYEWVGEYYDNLDSEASFISELVMKKGELWAVEKNYTFVVDDAEVIVNSKSSSDEVSYDNSKPESGVFIV